MDLDRTKCPKRSSGQPPHCNCEEGYQLDDIHWYCRPWYLNVTHSFENSCEPYHNWNGTRCIKIPCPSYSLTPQLFLPNCSYVAPVPPIIDIYNGDKVTGRNEIYGSQCPAYRKLMFMQNLWYLLIFTTIILQNIGTKNLKNVSASNAQRAILVTSNQTVFSNRNAPQSFQVWKMKKWPF